MPLSEKLRESSAFASTPRASVQGALMAGWSCGHLHTLLYYYHVSARFLPSALPPCGLQHAVDVARICKGAWFASARALLIQVMRQTCKGEDAGQRHDTEKGSEWLAILEEMKCT